MTNFLPIPTLDASCQRYLDWVAPLLSSAERVNTTKIVQQFAANEGAQLQAALQQFAEQQQPQHGSWLIDLWRTSYLTIPKSLPLASNVGLRLDWPSQQSGIDKLVEFVSALVALHADYLDKKLDFSNLPALQRPFAQQWDILLGAARQPSQPQDDYIFASPQRQVRYLVVHWRGKAYAVNLLDQQHRVVSQETLAQSLAQIMADKAEPSDSSFNSLSLADRATAAQLIVALQQSDNNKQVLQLLNESLFHLVLDNSQYADPQTALAAVTFQQQRNCWSYKPTTYWFNLHTDDLVLYCEHSWLDAGCLKEIIKQAYQRQQLERSSASTAASVQPLHWQLTAAQQQQLAKIEQDYHRQAQDYICLSVDLAFDERILPPKTSKDGLAQLMLQYAQLAVFGCIRNTYEALDMSHFANGRTEAMRPVSQQSVRAAQAMLTGQATLAEIDDFLVEHKNRIKCCKLGNGIDRHLLGLQLMAQQLGLKPELFQDIGYQRLTNDFFSTSSLGNQDFIKEFAFAPTVEQGFGISYAVLPDKFCFLFSAKRQQQEQVNQLLQALQRASQQLQQLYL